MTKEELKEGRLALKSVFESNERKLIREFCDSNNPYKVGDIFTDHIGSIKVERITYSYYPIYGSPCCIYEGVVLNKNLKPTKKKQTARSSYQSNDIKNKP